MKYNRLLPIFAVVLIAGGALRAEERLSGAIGKFICNKAHEKGKKALAVFPFTNEKDEESSRTKKMTTRIMGRISACGLKLIDKSKLMKVLEEQSLGQSGMIDSDSAPEAGHMIGADTLVFGSLDQESLQVRLVDSETGEVLGADVQEDKPASGSSEAKAAPEVRIRKEDPAGMKKDFNDRQLRRLLGELYRNRPVLFLYATANAGQLENLKKKAPRLHRLLLRRVEKLNPNQKKQLEEIRPRILKAREENPRIDRRARRLQRRVLKRLKKMKGRFRDE